ncbi:hypothetical protein EVAR_7575_1 [Eumeta japonica]|uniref:Uncharacterized protein n=1 Tax=Eumeta variegata TaxID=151549 RepID=A0A4C1VRY6_EUMVA|nr:hypothetical protein EVAR_7575_1 [Eumeta japonica]
MSFYADDSVRRAIIFGIIIIHPSSSIGGPKSYTMSVHSTCVQQRIEVDGPVDLRSQRMLFVRYKPRPIAESGHNNKLQPLTAKKDPMASILNRPPPEIYGWTLFMTLWEVTSAISGRRLRKRKTVKMAMGPSVSVDL